jgi:hypothetical protein
MRLTVGRFAYRDPSTSLIKPPKITVGNYRAVKANFLVEIVPLRQIAGEA